MSSKFWFLALFALMTIVGTCAATPKNVAKPVASRPSVKATSTRPEGKEEKWPEVEMRLTAYCNEGPSGCKICNGKWAKFNRTASGKVPKWGMVAADKSRLPFGTQVEIPKLGRFTVEDTGSAIKGLKLDIFFGNAPGSHERARKFGAPTRLVRVKGWDYKTQSVKKAQPAKKVSKKKK